MLLLGTHRGAELVCGVESLLVVTIRLMQSKSLLGGCGVGGSLVFRRAGMGRLIAVAGRQHQRLTGARLGSQSCLRSSLTYASEAYWREMSFYWTGSLL